MKNQITVMAVSMEDALNKAKRYLHVDDINKIEYEAIENDGAYIKVLCKLREDQLENTVENHNGYFKIFYRNNFAYLVVYPPQGNGKPVYEEDVINRMKVLSIPSVNILYIRDIIDRARCTPEKLIEWPKGVEFRAEIQVHLSEDKMQAIVNIKPPRRGGGAPTEEDVFFALRDFGVNYGIEKNTIKKIIDEKKYNEDIVVANGLRVVESQAKQIVYAFDTEFRKPFLFDEFGRVNLRELNFIQEKKQGEQLAYIVDAKPGVAGVNVLGETIEPRTEVDDCKFCYGDNVYLSEDGQQLLASIDGYIVYKNGFVSMQEVVRVNDVNFSTGNIDFDGAVIVSGTVADGFSIRATGIIQVGQCVGRVKLISDSDVILKSGINASGDGIIECKGNFYSRFVENTKLKVKGNCFIEEALLNTNSEVTGNIVLSGKRAEIIGGKTIVGGSVLCRKIGSHSNVKTKLSVGVDPCKIDTLIKISDRIDELKVLSTKAQVSLDNTNRKLEKTQQETSIYIEETENKNKIIALQYRIADELKELEREYSEGKELLQAENNRYVVVCNTIFCGTEINFGKIEYEKKKYDINKIMLRYINEKIIESGFTEETLPEIFKK